MNLKTLIVFGLILMNFHSATLLASQGEVTNLLQKIEVKAIEQKSDRVFVVRDGKPLLSYKLSEVEQPIELMSAYKSIVALAIGRLLINEQLSSLDIPVHHFYPEWRQGRKAEITVRHLLNHTSGLQNVNNAGEEIYPSPDVIQLALAAELSDEPGAAARYNNKAVNLLAGVIMRASGMRMDKFLVQELFTPLEITEYKFYYDAAGNPHAMAGLELKASDVVKLGQLVADFGLWQGEPLVTQAYVEEMLGQSQPLRENLGLLWWRQSFFAPNGQTYWLYYAQGYLGQYIMVVPELKLIGVRQLRRPEHYNFSEVEFKEFKPLMIELAQVILASQSIKEVVHD
ncbi:6-aminohexanoate-dimer hydrolase [Alishewanella longhuensis]|uniref:6-aminohexanoate-dimer hydrolase n=1 Tax=Alishewanella longhuensis TaxID=1091037 RepID=A0ABQ3KTJ0_9ALTE|nr:serine hydrolase domain-containing protein [Alishewanella longhuensis]GHG58948.1 6-aminohexanoate-dimer hydrolase [Alishewanella longhuensis]